MEWVEKTGKSVDEAKERALDQLGVAEKDAELVVLAEPKTGLFGRVRGEARVRARVRPAEPRPKRARRQRDRIRATGTNSGSGGDTADGGTRTPRQRGASANGSGGKAARVGRSDRAGRDPSVQARDEEDGSAGQSPASRRRRRRRRNAARKRGAGVGSAGPGQLPGDDVRSEPDGTGLAVVVRGREGAEEEHAVAEGITLEEQAAVAKEFLEGLLDRYGFEATVDVRELDEETVELAAHGDGLGVLVGPKGATVMALQDVTRTVVQKHFPNRTDRILVDVAGYRERRIAALRRFTTEVAAEVLESGSERALEPMSAADRKVVHDTVLTIEGVASSSQGEEPHRFVVILPGS